MTLFSPFALLRLLLMGAAPNQSFQLQAIPFARGGEWVLRHAQEKKEKAARRERERESSTDYATND
jgi:hypothetical protein